MKIHLLVFATTLSGWALGAPTTTVWNPAGNGIFPPNTGGWSEGANWTGGTVPDGDFKAVFNISGAAECVLSGAVSVTHLVTGDQGPGGTLRLASGASLTCTDWGGPFNRSSRIVVEEGASANFQTKLLIGQFDDPGDHEIEFRINGGTVEVGTVVRIGESFDDTNVVPHIQIDGGTLTADRLDIARGTTDVTAGTIILRTNQSDEIIEFINDGKLTGYGGGGVVFWDWNVRNANRLTITAEIDNLPGLDDPLLPSPTASGPGSEGYHTTGSAAGRPVWIAENMLYFDVPDATFPVGQPVYLRIEYLDEGRGRLAVKYDSNTGDTGAAKFRQSETHARSDRVNRGGFAFSYHELANPLFANRQNGGNDFRIELANNGGEPFQIASVALSSEPFPDPVFSYSLARPWLGPYAGPSRDWADPTTTSGKVMTGYQGWFAAPNDPEDSGWIHWGRSASVDPSPTEITVDMWPWPDDYDRSLLYPAGEMTHEDGRRAFVFSSRDPETVRTHFRWMRQHDIDGAYLQRFVSRNRSGAFGAPEFVLHNVRRAANLEGRVWAIEYDVSSMANDPDPFEVISRDWDWLVNEARILEDPRYLHHDGKPVLFIWGFSVPGREGLSVAEGNTILDWFRTKNLHLIGGVHSTWLGATAWHGHFRKYDQILAWMERDPADLAAQKAQLDAWNMTILPHAWPGFSWHNLQKLQPDSQYTPRNGGAFYWERLHNAVAVGADQIFLGMFDEYDEGTAIMPMADLHPAPHSAWGKYIDNEGRDPFWYLRLSAAAREMLNGFRPLNAAMPADAQVPPTAFSGQDGTIHLGDPGVSEGLQHPQPADGVTVPVTMNGREGRVISSGKYLYFALDDGLAFAAPGAAATVQVEFFDNQPGTTLRLQYDSVAGAYTQHPVVIDPPESGGWQVARWQIDDAYFGNRQNGGADLRIAQFGGDPIPVRRVSVIFPYGFKPGAEPMPEPLRWREGALEWSVLDDATGWRLFRSPGLESSGWEEVFGFGLGNGVLHFNPDFQSASEFYRLQRARRK
jgi:hypothetical protein